MFGRAVPKPRPTVEDAPDKRVPGVFVRRLSLAELRVIERPGSIDPRLRPADRWLERWAATHGSGEVLPLAAVVDLVPHSTPLVPILEDDDYRAIEDTVKTSPQWARTFVTLWYRMEYTATEIAVILRMPHRQAVQSERRTVLAYYLGCFAELGLRITIGGAGY